MKNELDYIDGERFESLADISFGEENSASIITELKYPLVYCSTNNISDLFAHVRKHECVIDLISHNGDVNFENAKDKPNNIRFWYSQNIMYNDKYI